ncbi:MULTISPECIES: helix-turn-helix transcriptional regulator [unclassified Bradyrhizobium]|uniref:helix-turn-helix domain-containing protein n=1 Tax=unclassified Bradyrhizobium TaxID=2631580 RepID=UPI0029167DDF|nr:MULTISPECIES: helix-turn-helix transcriptional regulator [unclassified Bradyrhizobium]
MSRDAAIGSHLAALREQARLKQNELAKKLEWSAAVLSRVESGERSLTDDELDILLRGIGTPEAARLKEILARRWKRLPEPSLSDADADFLYEAEQVAQEIHALAEQPDVKQLFERRLVRYEEELRSAAQHVLDKRYRVAFMGTIGVGKSTSICRIEGLELPSAKGMPNAVLETGAGGITICDVHVRKGPGYGLIIEPCSEDEIRHHVMDLANSLLNPAKVSDNEDDEAGTGSPGISREIDRALRSMTGLRRRRSERKPDGSIIPASDDARDLAVSHPDAKALSVEILARMELHRRDRRDLWHDAATGKPPLVWLQENFEKINNGRHPEFTVPKRIEVVVPVDILGDQTAEITLIDSRGIDDLAARADLEQHFDDPHTLVMLCTLFAQAPSTEVRQLLTRAKEAGVRTLGTQAAILALPRAGEALAVKFEGELAQSDQEGYDLKGDEVRLKLHALGLDHLPIAFFNSATDEPENLRAFIAARIEAIRESHRATLREIVAGAKDLLANYEKEQAAETMRAAGRRLSIWLRDNTDLPRSSSRRVHDSLMSTTRAAHWKTIYATISRRGGWPNLDYAHQLSHGARRIATQIVEAKIEAFKTLAGNIISDEELVEAHDLAKQAVRALESGFDEMIRNAQLVGESIYADDLREDLEFWRTCSAIEGRGYKDRVNQQNQHWFDEKRHGEAEARVMDLVAQKWGEAVTEVRALLPEG